MVNSDNNNPSCQACLHSAVSGGVEPCNSCLNYSKFEMHIIKFDSKVESKASTLAQQYPHYHKQLPEGVKTIDVYRVLSLFEVTDPCLQHAIKKLLCAGARGAKDTDKDVAEAAVSIRRYQEMRDEETK